MFLRRSKAFTDDSSLWESFLAGNEGAYCHIYDRYAKSLFVQGLQFSSDKELIKDCIHDIFVKIYENRTSLKPVYNLKVYLFIALRNSISTALRKQKIWVDELEEDTTYHPDENSVEDELIIKEAEISQKQLVENIFAMLTDRQREAIHYRFIQALSIDEICIVMGMNYQSVQNLLQRSIKKIRISLKKR